MAAKKLVIVAHGIGDQGPDFWREWEAVLNKNHDKSKFEVKGLYWEDLRDKAVKKFPLFSDRLKEALKLFGTDTLFGKLDSKDAQNINDYVSDVLYYTLLAGLGTYIRKECRVRLGDLCGTRKSKTILIGHSLGAAMLPHITWMERQETGVLPYLGLLLLASPLSIHSPNSDIVPDLLDIMGRINQVGNRLDVLRSFASEWTLRGAGALRFFVNVNDMVCSDVTYQMPLGIKFDPLSDVVQSFTAAELETLEQAHAGSVVRFVAGNNRLQEIGNNHDVNLYLNRPEFQAAFDTLLNQ